MHTCCSTLSHRWDQSEVSRLWVPERLFCIVIGENPGSDASEYFYAPPVEYADDPVTVRRRLLRGLYQEDLIAEPTLEGFRDAGFLFDHGIRCSLSRAVIQAERRAARRYQSVRVGKASHLAAYVAQAASVW